MNQHRAFLLLTIAVSGLITFVLVLPFLEYILGAIILAYVLYPLHVRLVPHVGRRVSPFVLIAFSILVVLVPLGYITLALYRDLQALAAGETDLDVREIEAQIADATGVSVDLGTGLATAIELLIDALFGSVTELVSLVITISIGLALMLFLVYYLLRDGADFVTWTIDTIPLPDDVTAKLFDQINRTTWGVIIGHLAVAFIEGIVGGFGLYVAGLPNVVFWSFVMMVLSLLPLIGAFLVWGPAVGYLVLIEQTGAAVFLLMWGLLVVGLIDNYARPILVDREAQLNPGVILVGVLGGVYMLGFTGLFIGPVVIGILAATITTFKNDYDSL